MEELLHDVETCFASLGEENTILLGVAEKEGSTRSTIDVLDEQIRKLEAERQRQWVATARTQAQDAHAKAITAGAERLATVLLRQGEEQETLGNTLSRQGNTDDALNAYRIALDFFIKAHEEASVTAALQAAEQARQEMQTAKMAAERVGAREKARTFYRRALALQAQADEQWEAQAYQQAGALYGEARVLFADARDLASPDGLKAEEEAIRQSRVTADSLTSRGMAANTETQNGEDASGSWSDIQTPYSSGDFTDPQQETRQRNVLQTEEDHWEIGERTEALERDPPPQSTQSAANRTLLLVAGVAAVLAVAGWFGWSLIQQPSVSPPTVVSPQQSPPQSQPPPPPALTFSSSEPREETLSITEGESIAFMARVSGAEPLAYQWTFAGNPVSQEPQWTYQAAQDGSEVGTKTVKVRVADQTGQSVEKSWQVTVAAANKPPRVVAATPSKAALELINGEEQSFRLEAEDPEQGTLEYEWTVDGKKTGAQPTFTWKAVGEGQHDVKAVVKGQSGLSAAHEWQVMIVAAPPPPPPATPAVPQNAAPRIAQRLPTERVVAAREGETVQFSALALDPEGEEVVYNWSVDGKRAAQGDRFTYAASVVGTHLVDLEVTDKGGLKDAFRWNVQVEAPPAAPRVTMYTPHAERLQLYSHLSRFFAVEVETPGAPESPIQYAWKIDGRSTAGRELLEFKDQSPGQHEVEVTATGPSGASVTHRWVVEVQKRPDMEELEFGGPPHLEMFELDNEVSSDKKQVVVRGRLRNVGDQEAENVVVWISALDAQQRTLSRRLALPSPQPLSSDQVATFAFAFANQSVISDFRVEIVIK